MSRYILAYSGGHGMPDTEAEQAEVMAAWGAWFGQLGDAVVDGGNPFGAAKTIGPDGSVRDGGSTGLTGFSVIDADGLDAAVDLAKGCPVLSSDGTVDVYEGVDM